MSSHRYLHPQALQSVFEPRGPLRHSGESVVPHSLHRYSVEASCFRFFVRGLAVHAPVSFMVCRRDVAISIPISPTTESTCGLVDVVDSETLLFRGIPGDSGFGRVADGISKFAVAVS